MLRRSLSAVLPVKQVSHSGHIVLDTCVLYTLLNFTYLFISLLNLYPDSELIITDIISKNLHSVYRSLEIHNCALTSSPLSPPPPPSPHTPPPPGSDRLRELCFFSLCCTMMADPSGRPPAGGVAQRRRERRLRAMLRHEQVTVRMALAAALHHSAGPKEKKVELQQYAALRGQKTEVHEKNDAPRRQNAPHPGERPSSLFDPGAAGDNLPTLALPSLAGSAGEVVDSSSPHCRFLQAEEGGGGGEEERGGEAA